MTHRMDYRSFVMGLRESIRRMRNGLEEGQDSFEDGVSYERFMFNAVRFLHFEKMHELISEIEPCYFIVRNRLYEFLDLDSSERIFSKYIAPYIPTNSNK